MRRSSAEPRTTDESIATDTIQMTANIKTLQLPQKK